MLAEAKVSSTESAEALVLQDVDDIFKLASKRKVLASLIGTLTVLQYAKIISMQGSAAVVIPTKVLATVFFLYWLTNEATLLALRFSNRYIESDAISMALNMRSNWQFTTRKNGKSTFRAPLTIIGGLLHTGASVAIAMAVFGVGTDGIHVHGEPVSDTINALGTVFILALPISVFYLCFWDVIDFQAGLSTTNVKLHFWFTNQGVHFCLLTLLYYCCVYDSDGSRKAEWTEWIP